MIRRIHTTNFKSLRDTTVDLRHLNVFVGPNMAGKSNVIHLFRFLSRMVLPSQGTYGLPNAFQFFGGFPEVFWKGASAQSISIDVEGDGFLSPDRAQDESWKYSISISGDQYGNGRVLDESLVVISRRGAEVLIETQSGKRTLLDKDGKRITQVDDPMRSALEFEIPNWEGNYLRQLFASARFYQFIPKAMRGQNPSVSAKFLNEIGDNLSSWFMTLQTQYRESFDRVESVMRDALPGFVNLFTIPSQQSTVAIASREKFLNKPVPLSQMSDGELAFAALLSLICSPVELAAPIYCLDDIESYLHPRLIDVLMEIYHQVASEFPPEQRAQILVATHSPFVIDKCGLENLIVVEKRSGETTCTRPDSNKHLQELVASREMGLGELYFSGALRSADF
jgi:predicted ATPase